MENIVNSIMNDVKKIDIYRSESDDKYEIENAIKEKVVDVFIIIEVQRMQLTLKNYVLLMQI